MRRERRKRNSFTDMMIVIFVVLVCFGLTIYGIVYLTGKIFGVEEKANNITVATNPIVTDPEDGDIIIYTDNQENTTKPEVIANTNDNKYPNVIIDSPTPPIAKANEPKNNFVNETPKTETPVVRNDTTPQKPEPKKPDVKKEEKPKQNIVKKEETQVASLEKGDFAVQIMAVKSQSAAEAEAAKYRNICPDVAVVRADLGEKGVWYRIRCGINSTKADAEILKNRLMQAFPVKPTVVSNK